MAANIRCIMRAKAPYGQGITKLKVNFSPEQPTTPSLMPETNTVYLSRATEGTGELMELVGGSVAWNQLCNSSSVTGTSGHKFYLKKSGAESITNTNTFTGLASGTDMVTDLTLMLGSAIADYVYSLEQATAGSGVAWLKSYGYFTDYVAYSAPTLQSVEATAHVTKDANDATIATYPLDSDLVLRGIPKLDSDNALYYDGDTYEWDGTVTRKYGTITVNGTESWLKSNAYPGNYYISQFVPNTSGYSPNIVNNYTPNIATNLSQLSNYERCVMFDGAATNKNLNIKNSDIASVADFKTWLSSNPITIVYKLATPTTESADPYTAVQTVEDGGTEEFTTSNNVPVGVVGRFANAVPMEGVDSFTVTANDGTTHTYPVTLSAEIYRGTVDMLTGEAVSDMASIAEYNGETINSPWLSSLDVYSEGATPTTGAQVVYPITAEEVTATITGDPSELVGVVSATSTEGTVTWSELSEIGIKCVMKLKDPFN